MQAYEAHTTPQGLSRRLSAGLTMGATNTDLLTSQTLFGLRQTFDTFGHHPTEEMWTALSAAVSVMARAADDNEELEPLVYVSSLDPGVGKTQAVLHFMRALMASPAGSQSRGPASAIVCVNRKSQIEEFLNEGDFDPADFGILTSDKELNAYGHPEPQRARLLLTTHQMVMTRCDGSSFQERPEFQFLGRPRDVRVWDEAMLPGKPLTLTRYEMARLFEYLPMKLRDHVEEFFGTLKTVEAGTQLMVPNFEEIHEMDRDKVKDRFPVDDRVSRERVEILWSLGGRTVSVSREGSTGEIVLDYEETLPNDLAPVLIFDASARVRETYQLWEHERGGLEILPSAAKRYDRLTVNVWEHASGRGSINKNRDKMAQAITSTIAKRLDEEWLVIHHQKAFGREGLMEKDVMASLPKGAKVHFLHWGRHDAINQFANVPNVILAGLLFYREADYEAQGRLSAAFPASKGPFPDDKRKRLQLGEHQHHILQALCRAKVRRCETDGGCPETNAYIIAGKKTGIREALATVFPGVVLKGWAPAGLKALAGQRKEALAFIKRRLFEEGAKEVRFSEVMEEIGMMDAGNFSKVVRRHRDFTTHCEVEGVVEVKKGARFHAFATIAEAIGFESEAA